jgi:hypothetical protein
VKSGTVTAAAFTVIFVLSAASATAQAPQTLPPLPGFVPPFEITRIVRAAGFDPLAPPLRQGGTYVVRATDFRGTLMRVVVDGRSGAIRAVNRIVAASEAYGQVEMLPPPYGAPPSYVEPVPPEFARPGIVPFEQSAAPDLPSATPALGPPPAAHTMTSGFPPLPRPRPAELASRKAADEIKSDTKSTTKADQRLRPKSDAAPGLTPTGEGDVKTGTAASGSAVVPTAPRKSPGPSIND